MNKKQVGVVGGGVMGHGIAQISAEAGFEVNIVDQTPELVQSSLATIRKGLDRKAGSEKITREAADEAFARITGGTDLAGLAECHLVIEAVTEDAAVKTGVWRALEPILDPDAVRASNTSSLSVVEQGVVSARPDRFVGLHFFNPPQVMNLVEVIGAITTSEDTRQTVLEFADAIGKDVVEVPDLAGFLVNRLLVPYTMEAIRVLEAGYGTVAEIDLGMKAGAGHPMGPLTLLDFVGLDTAMKMTEVMFEEYRDSRFAAPPLLRKMVTAGHLGRKTGRGFYDYSGERPVPAALGPKPLS